MARIVSFTALLCVFAGYYLTLTLREFLPLVSLKLPVWNYPLGFVGAALGAFLCPLFLPFREKGGLVKNGLLAAKTGKPFLAGSAFILLITLPQIIIRSMGVEFWITSIAAVSILPLSTGIFYPMSHGLFFLSGGRQKGFLLSIAIIGAVVLRYLSLSLLETSDPAAVLNVLFRVIKWLLTAGALLSALCIALITRAETLPAPEKPAMEKTKREKPDTPRIINLICISALFNIMNASVEMKLFPFMSGSAGKPESLYIFGTAAAVLLCSFFAGKSTNRFFLVFLPPVIALFILLPVMVLFREINPALILVMSILVSTFRFTIWAVFTAVIMESYAGGFYFYLAAAAVYLTQIFSFLGPIIYRLLPKTMEATIGVMLVTATAFVLLAIRIIYPKLVQQINNPVNPMLGANYEDIFKEHKLSQREKEVACLMVIEGLGKNEIGTRLFITPGTVKTHIINIYKKFNVNSQKKFMVLFVNKGVKE